MGRRTLLLIAAVLVAAMGSTLIYLYVRGVDQRALAGQQLVRVLVATGEIPLGTTGEQASAQGLLDTKEIPRSAAAEGAVGDAADISTRRANSKIYPGEQILLAKFGEPEAAQRLPIPPGRMAVSVELSDPARVADFLMAGNNVAVFVTMANPEGGSPAAPDPQQAADFTRVLLPSVQVVAVGSTSLTPETTGDAAAGAATVPRTLLTLSLTQDEAERVIYAQTKGELYFALLPAETTVEAAPGTSYGNLFR